MIKQLILATILALFAISCSKPDNTPPPIKEYFRGKLNGVFFSDSLGAGMITLSTPRWGPTQNLIEGHYSNGVITLWLNQPYITIGERLLNQANLDAIRISTYRGEDFYAGFNGFAGSPGQGSGKISILEITSSYVRGTFECIAPADSAGGTILPPMYITEGEFKLK